MVAVWHGIYGDNKPLDWLHESPTPNNIIKCIEYFHTVWHWDLYSEGYLSWQLVQQIILTMYLYKLKTNHNYLEFATILCYILPRDMMELIYKQEFYEIKSACIEIKNVLGPGFLEKVYENDR